MKKLTKRQKEIESQRQVKNWIKNTFEPMVLNKIETLLKESKLPKNWLIQEDNLLSRFAVHLICKKIVDDLKNCSEQTKTEFENLKNL